MGVMLKLVEFDLSANFFEGFLQRLSFVFGNAFLNGLGSTVNEFLSLFQTKAGEFLH